MNRQISNIVGRPAVTDLNEFGRVERIALRHPRDAFVSDAKLDAEWNSLNYLARPDLSAAIDEYDELLRILSELGTAIEFLPADDKLTLDAIYVRDATLLAADGVVMCRMGKAARQHEPEVAAQVLAARGWRIAGAIAAPGLLEGGDVVWLDAKTIVVGEGYRTNAEGIRQLQTILGDGVEVISVPLPHWQGENDVFHLMSMFSPVDIDLAVVYSPLMPVPFRQLLLSRGMTLIEVPEAEFATMACNVLAIAPRRCVALAGNPLTIAEMQRHGIEVYAINGHNISCPGSGGPTCLTRPICRGE